MIITKKTLSDMGIDLDPMELCKVRGGIDSTEDDTVICHKKACRTRATGSSEYSPPEFIEPSDPEPEPEEMFRR